ncbi:hypothetical protein OSCI_780020 [Kamptonema sp. PCC 6506]|nr:hypothetical protein OSCI_780020 [Kamptonema sp. PCC 6506]
MTNPDLVLYQIRLKYSLYSLVRVGGLRLCSSDFNRRIIKEISNLI